MRICEAALESVSPYSQSRPYTTPKLNDKEQADAYEERTWRDRMWVTNGEIVIPPMAFKNALSEIAKFLSVKIPGKRNATYTKHFEAGIMVPDPVMPGIKAKDVNCERLFVPSDGQRGGGRRVWKNFPLIPNWKAKVIFYLLDDEIPEDIFEYHLREAGQLTGIGRFRPGRNGFYGRWRVLDCCWSVVGQEVAA